MNELRKNLKKAILDKHGTIEKWATYNNIPTSRFYNFLKGTYNPTLKTIEIWLASVELDITTYEKRKG